MNKLFNNRRLWLNVAWGTALVGMLGSLYFSEFAGLEPCRLCWFQRIAMYPIVLIGIVGYVTKDSKWHRYAMPLAILGLLVGIYHNLLQWGFIAESCPAVGPSCVQTNPWFGFITIPLLSLVALVVIVLSLWLAGRNDK